MHQFTFEEKRYYITCQLLSYRALVKIARCLGLFDDTARPVKTEPDWRYSSYGLAGKGERVFFKKKVLLCTCVYKNSEVLLTRSCCDCVNYIIYTRQG